MLAFPRIAHDKLLQLYSTLCDPRDRSLPGSTIHGILQARILKQVAMPSSRGSSQPRDQTFISWVSWIGRQILYRQHYLVLNSYQNSIKIYENQSFLTFQWWRILLGNQFALCQRLQGYQKCPSYTGKQLSFRKIYNYSAPLRSVIDSKSYNENNKN